eukprot:1642457-Rhodomonas_salina.1
MAARGPFVPLLGASGGVSPLFLLSPDHVQERARGGCNVNRDIIMQAKLDDNTPRDIFRTPRAPRTVPARPKDTECPHPNGGRLSVAPMFEDAGKVPRGRDPEHHRGHKKLVILLDPKC